MFRVAADVLTVLSMALWALAATAQQPYEPRSDDAALAQVLPLLEAMQMGTLLEAMQIEGTDYAEALQGDMFPGRGGDRWRGLVERIYDLDRMNCVMLDEMAARLDAHHVDLLLAFFTSELGQRIIGLEVSARRALRDESIDVASREALEHLRETDPARIKVLEEFVAANELVEMNVAGALNSNYAFFDGLNSAGAHGQSRSESEILREIWIEEPSIRAESEAWVYSYLAMAYGPLTNDEIREYTVFSETPEGQALNAGLFAAFDVLFEIISRELGMAAAQFVTGEDI